MLWPFAARAQRPVIGFLGSATAAEWAALVAAFNAGLNQNGYTDGHNIAIEYRWAQDQYDRMPTLALDLVARRVDLIAATGGTRSIQSAMTATRTIPIVFVSGGDPIQLGLVASLDRPAGNVTGVMFSDTAFAAKRLDIIKTLVPHARTVAALFNSNNPITQRGIADMSAAARAHGLLIHFLFASTPDELDRSFAGLAGLGATALVVHADPFLLNQRDAIVALAVRHRMPVIYGLREFAVAGGLMSYGASILNVFQQAGAHAARILSGVRPGDLPVLQSTSSELVVNLRSARALGIDIPASLRAAADQVIE
jgi:putative ABC transport system substrate-binding protein